jgi:hypothetical protein
MDVPTTRIPNRNRRRRYCHQDRLFNSRASPYTIRHSDRGNYVTVGDYSAVLRGRASYHILQASVHDVLAMMIADGSLSLRLDAVRLEHYYNLTTALSNGNLRLVRGIGKTHRSELDVMKVSFVIQ